MGIGFLCDGVLRGKLERHAKGVVFFISRKEFFVSNCIRFEKVNNEREGGSYIDELYVWVFV